MYQVFAERQVYKKYLANWKDVVWRLWILRRHMIRSIDTAYGTCLECKELEKNC